MLQVASNISNLGSGHCSGRSLCEFCSRKIWRDLVLGTCYSSGAAVHFVHLVKLFHPRKVTERWGVLIEAIDQALSCQEAFTIHNVLGPQEDFRVSTVSSQ